MSLLQAIVLGIVQGLTEFLPISSSGHLILVPYFFDWDPQELTFDVSLHAGTLLAVLFYFRQDWLRLLAAGLRDLRQRRLTSPGPDSRLLLLLALGSIPAAVAGAALSGFEDGLRRPGVVAAMLVVVAGLMWVAERLATPWRGMDRVSANDTLFIGAAQATALVPGVSRSAITISAGLVRGLNREAATRFSFLLATPVVFGAALFAFAEAAAEPDGEPFEWAPFLAGSATAALVGLLTIHFLLRYLRFHTLRLFIWYRIALAAAVLVVATVR